MQPTHPKMRQRYLIRCKDPLDRSTYKPFCNYKRYGHIDLHCHLVLVVRTFVAQHYHSLKTNIYFLVNYRRKGTNIFTIFPICLLSFNHLPTPSRSTWYHLKTMFILSLSWVVFERVFAVALFPTGSTLVTAPNDS